MIARSRLPHQSASRPIQAASPGPPRVWVLADDRPGSTRQSTGLARALGWPFEVKPLVFGPLAALSNRLLDARGGSRLSLRRARSAPLEPPWPDLVIAAGRRSAPVAQWIRRRAGGQTRLVLLGRKGGDDAHRFDLVITPRYAGLAPHPRRLVVSAPLHDVTAARLAEARERWRSAIGSLPGPRLALLAGGSSGQYWMDRATAARLGRDVAARARGGSLLVATSRRTGTANEDALLAALAGSDPATFVARWSAGAPQDAYLGILAWADEIVATADSESMLAEAAATGRPLQIYPLRVRASFPGLRLARGWVTARALPATDPGSRDRPPGGPIARGCRRVIDLGWVRPTRDLEALHGDLIRRGLAVRFGAPPPRAAPARALPELERAARRVRELFPGAPGA